MKETLIGLGFIAADGTILKNSYGFAIELAGKDKSQLVKLALDIGLDTNKLRERFKPSYFGLERKRYGII